MDVMKKVKCIILFLIVMSVTVIFSGCKKSEPCTVALLHMNPEYQQKEENIDRICQYAAEAFKNNADIVVTPEMATDDYFLTKEDVIEYAGIKDIEEELSSVADIADQYDGYICIGFPEIASDGSLYNAAVLFNKDGEIVLKERKRAIPSWNLPGDLEPAVADTEFGKIGIVICADSYTPENVSALKDLDADIILSPVTWFSSNAPGHSDTDNIDTWKARAKENSVWYAVCNRWGIETLDGEPQDMNNAPSVIVTADGEIVLNYSAEDSRNYADEILYYEMKP